MFYSTGPLLLEVQKLILELKRKAWEGDMNPVIIGMCVSSPSIRENVCMQETGEETC